MRASKFLLPLCALIGVGLATPALGDWPDGTWTFQVENDRIARTDRHYTHGTRISWVSDRQTDGPLWTREVLHTLYPFADLRAGRIGVVLGQNIYTPEDTEAVALVRDDRPYAGWLYLGASVHAETRRTEMGIPFDSLDTVELDIGIVGPYAFAEQTQNRFHDLIGVSRSNGWDNQLDTEPGVMLVFDRTMRPEAWDLGGPVASGVEADIVPHFGGAVGNVMTFLHAGGTVRLGQSLDADYGPPLIRPALSSLPAINGNGEFGWYVFAGADVRLVARNIFLDGNTFADSHSVKRKPLVGDVQVGFTILFDHVRLSFTHVFRTREFEGQRRADRYGALSLSARF